ncbi:DNA-binding protein [Paenibacillus sp. FSL R7-0216]|uniref:DNA-binding protein n=1 Tax=Paenibacillus sp. FSL R7-0216 TaxID=2921677 RepID=UPI0030D74DA9
MEKKFIINLIVRGNTLENGDVMNLPSIQDLLTKLQLVLINELQREEVADYAAQYVMNDDYEVQDEELWELLNIVSGIDLKDSPDEYLHDERDIRDWIHRFQRK